MNKTAAKPSRKTLGRASFSGAVAAFVGYAAAAIAGPPTVNISQVPMTVAIPAHPQIMLALANSQSMDGTLSGAIMTGAGSLGAAYASLNTSSSPANFSYTVGAGFTPPLNLGTVVCLPPGPCASVTAATPAGTAAIAPYTVNSSGTLYDNSPSRLNVAKASISAVLSSYIDSADFGLMDYSTAGLAAYETWVYQMSQVGGFVFTATPGANEYISNPCYGVNILPPLANVVQTDCQALSAFYPTQNIVAQPYVIVGASSDDPSINDVLYAPAGYAGGVCVVYGGPSPSSPFPPSPPGFTLAQYEAGSVTETYSHEVNGCATETGPTNAGYVPYSPQVMYEARGFGFYTTSESAATNWTPTVAMTSSGATPTAASVATAIAKFTPYLAPETNSTGTTEIKAQATQSPIASLIASAANYFSGSNPASTNGCVPGRYIVLITDGLPTMDLAGHSWPPLGSTAGSAPPNGYGINPTYNPYPVYATGSPTEFNANGSLNFTNDQAMTDVISKLANAYNNGAGIKTYIIGVGAGVDPTANPTAAATLTAMAIAGGTGSYFPASSPQQVSSDLDLIITAILAATQSTASAAVNSTGLNTNSVVYQSQFDTSDLFQDWTGNLFAYPVNANGSVNMTPIWSAQTQLDSQVFSQGQASRIIATWDPVAGAGTPFEWSIGTPTTGIATSTTLGQQLETFTPDTSGSDVLKFLRGSNAQEVRYGGQFRNRTHKLGDIVDSSPLYVGAPSAQNDTPSYVAFANANAARPPVIYVGANDGMLHAFDAATGNERFAYIPHGGYANLVKLASPYYNAQHQFYVNGSPQASDVQFANSTWHTVLVGAQAQGGASVYALDVTNPAAITAENVLATDVLWDFTDSDMGLGFSTPAITDTAAGWMVFVGNGYNNPNQKPVLYALNPQTGAIVRKIDLCATLVTNVCNMALSNGLSTVVAVNSSGQVSGFANVVYAGDLEGDLWRINVSNANPTLWTVTVLLQARDPVNGNPQPISTSPAATLNPNYPSVLGTMVYVATGQLLGVPDLTTTQVQTVYGVYDPQTGFTPPLTRGTVPTTPVGNFTSTTGFVDQTLSIPTSNNQVVVDTTNKVTIPTNNGWYADLTQITGERAVTDLRLESGGALVFTTYQPNFNFTYCTESGSSYLYVLNYATGGSFVSPQFDITGDGVINSADMVSVPNPAAPGTNMLVAPVGMSLGDVFAAAPTIRTANFTTASAVKLITESSGAIKSVVEKGSSKSRTAWWEIRQ
jgi:type IV pilus assembly protein PilY1